MAAPCHMAAMPPATAVGKDSKAVGHAETLPQMRKYLVPDPPVCRETQINYYLCFKVLFPTSKSMWNKVEVPGNRNYP